jgi:hypothetical protein
MAFKVEEKIEVGLGTASFKFNILSDFEGVRIWLTDYRLVSGKKTLKRWSHIGDNGTFIKREKIEIPNEVIESVKQKITNSIFVI